MLKTKIDLKYYVLRATSIICVPKLRPVLIILIHTELNSQAVILIVIWNYSKGDMRMTQGTVRLGRVG